MKGSKGKKDKKKKGSSSKSELDVKKHDAIQDKPYITREIETSITLLESPENSIVLEALLFLSKYADIQRNNLIFVHSCGLLPKLLALLDHNICILRVSLRLLSELLSVGAALIQLNEDKFDEKILKICNFYASHPDVNVKEFSILILEKYTELGKTKLLLGEPDLLKAIFKTNKSPETETILNSTLELFYRLIELQEVRAALAQEPTFKLDEFIERMKVSETCFKKILAIIEKLTYFNEDALQTFVRECKVIEFVFTIIIDPERKQYITTCLNILSHCMRNEITHSYFVQSLEFLKFCLWVKSCPEEFLQSCASVFLELAKIDSIRQMLFDLSIEDVILSLLKSDDKKLLNTVFEAVGYMSKHKYCCEKMVAPVVIKKVLQVLSTTGDNQDDPENETALTLLYYLSRRDVRTLHMIRAYSDFSLLLKYLNLDSEDILKKILDIINMFVTNYQLQSYILSKDLYSVILAHSQHRIDDISMKSVEIMINCLTHADFRDYFLENRNSEIVIALLANRKNENLIRLLVIFLHNAMVYEDLSIDLVKHKALLVLKRLPDSVKYRNPLVERVINAIYQMCLPLKFFESGRLEMVDIITARFYLIAGSWSGPFPFLEILEMRHMSTKTTIYVVDECVKSKEIYQGWLAVGQQYVQNTIQPHGGIARSASFTSLCNEEMEDYLNYGSLSRDPYLPKYCNRVLQLTAGVADVRQRVKIIAEFVDFCMCGPDEKYEMSDKMHSFRLHIECIKEKLGTNMIPIGYLRLGFHCERALLFKVLADQVRVPASLVRGGRKLYWNEIALIEHEKKTKTKKKKEKGEGKGVLKMFVVDLMNNIGQLLPVGSKECNAYCDIQ